MHSHTNAFKAQWALSEVAAMGLLVLGMVVMTRRLVMHLQFDSVDFKARLWVQI